MSTISSQRMAILFSYKIQKYTVVANPVTRSYLWHLSFPCHVIKSLHSHLSSIFLAPSSLVECKIHSRSRWPWSLPFPRKLLRLKKPASWTYTHWGNNWRIISLDLQIVFLNSTTLSLSEDEAFPHDPQKILSIVSTVK